MENNARLLVMMLEVFAFPSDTNDVVNRLETMELKIKEFERYYLGRCWTDEDAPHHEFAQIDNFPGHQDRGDERRAGAGCGDGKDG